MNLTTPKGTLSNTPKRDLRQLAASLKKNPAMLAKIDRIYADIKRDLRKRNTPSRAVMEAITHEDLAKLCDTPATSLSRFLGRFHICGDVLVGARLAFSKRLAGQIREAVYYSNLASEMILCADHMKDTQPEHAAEARDVAARHRAYADEILAKIPKFKI